jgi:ATP phosphoribosyltransferase regulatory subunit
MLKKDRWLLPEGIQEVLSPQALTIETYRRLLLDLYHSWGYDLVEPPVIDFLDSLLTGTGHDLHLMTFTLTDQLSGRLLGIRADMTPQVARIDAHHIKAEHPSRYCYIGKVLTTRMEGFAQSRSPLQVGIELYGHSGPESDIEVLSLMIETLTKTGLKDFHIDLGHVGIFRSLSYQVGLTEIDEATLFDALQRKAVTEMRSFFDQLDIAQKYKDQFMALIDLNGDISVIDQARAQLSGKEVHLELDNLQSIAAGIAAFFPQQVLYFDLAELRGYNYHTGVVFTAYLPGHGEEIAKGGRYDGIGETFGRSRAATGFSADLSHLVTLTDACVEAEKLKSILAPAHGGSCNNELEAVILQLRQQGQRVIRELPGQHSDAPMQGCDRKLSNTSGQWDVVEI